MAQTPWGQSDSCQVENAGIKFYGTPSHGGYYVPAKVNRIIPDYMRLENGRNGAGWYEEDCDWCLPVIGLGAEYFPNIGPETVLQAWDSFRNWHPASYEQYTGVTLREGESYMRDDELFRERTRNSLVVVAALGRDDGMVVCHACMGGRGKDGRYQGALRLFLVPKEEYKAGRFGFILDPAKYREIEDAKAA